METTRNIDLLGLDVEVMYTYQKADQGGTHPAGGVEQLPARISIYSVMCKGIDIISLLSSDQLEDMEREILEGMD